MRQLVAAGWQVVAVARKFGGGGAIPGVIRVAADIAGDGWQRWCEGCGAAIHLVGIIRESPRHGATFDRVHRVGTERVVAACRGLGIRRLLHMSALGTRQGASTAYHRSKWAGEQVVRASDLAWTIFRPAAIFGPGDGFSSSLARALRLSPVVPVFGDGNVKLQPIGVQEVAEVFVAALQREDAAGRVVELGGPEALTYNEVLRRTAQALGLRRSFVHLPLGLSRLLVRLLGLLPDPPITPDELTMLLEGGGCDMTAAHELFGTPETRYQGPTWLRGQGSVVRRQG